MSGLYEHREPGLPCNPRCVLCAAEMPNPPMVSVEEALLLNEIYARQRRQIALDAGNPLPIDGGNYAGRSKGDS